MYNFKKNRIAKSSNLYNQCQKDFFYDNDNVIEKNLSILEMDAAKLIKKIIKTESISTLTTNELYNILFFVILQSSRTEVSSNKVSQLGKVFLDSIVGDDKLKIEKGHVLAMEYTWMLTYIASDLKLALLINQTEMPFITSDHPVSLINSVFDKIDNKSLGGTGYAKKGLIITFPISSKLCLIYYDYGSYFFCKGENKIIINNIDNVYSINRLIASTCNENFYFEPLLSDEFIINIISNSKWKGNRKYNSTSIENIEKLINDNSKLRLRSGSIPEYRNFSLNGIMKINKKGRRFIEQCERDKNIINTAEGIRSVYWVNLVNDFFDEVKKGKYKQNEIYKYIEDKELSYE